MIKKNSFWATHSAIYGYVSEGQVFCSHLVVGILLLYLLCFDNRHFQSTQSFQNLQEARMAYRVICIGRQKGKQIELPSHVC